jgi:single-strand DNA-binding protein
MSPTAAPNGSIPCEPRSPWPTRRTPRPTAGSPSPQQPARPGPPRRFWTRAWPPRITLAERSCLRARIEPSRDLTDDPEVRHTEGGSARAMFRVAVSGRREQEASFFTVVVWRDQVEHASQSLSRGSRVVVMGRLQQRSWTAEDGSARSVVEVVAEELGPSLRWATATTTRTTRSQASSDCCLARWISRSRWAGILPYRLNEDNLRFCVGSTPALEFVACPDPWLVPAMSPEPRSRSSVLQPQLAACGGDLGGPWQCSSP